MPKIIPKWPRLLGRPGVPGGVPLPGGGVWEASGGPLGRRWALLARLLALLGVFGGVSGVVLGAIGQEA